MLPQACFTRIVSSSRLRSSLTPSSSLRRSRLALALVLPYRGFFTTRVSLQFPGPLVPQIPRVHESVWSLTRGSPPTRVGLDAALLARSSRWPCRSSRRCSGCRSRRCSGCRSRRCSGCRSRRCSGCRSPRRSPRLSSCSLLPLPLLQISTSLWPQTSPSISSALLLSHHKPLASLPPSSSISSFQFSSRRPPTIFAHTCISLFV